MSRASTFSKSGGLREESCASKYVTKSVLVVPIVRPNSRPEHRAYDALPDDKVEAVQEELEDGKRVVEAASS